MVGGTEGVLRRLPVVCRCTYRGRRTNSTTRTRLRYGHDRGASPDWAFHKRWPPMWCHSLAAPSATPFGPPRKSMAHVRPRRMT